LQRPGRVYQRFWRRRAREVHWRTCRDRCVVERICLRQDLDAIELVEDTRIVQTYARRQLARGMHSVVKLELRPGGAVRSSSWTTTLSPTTRSRTSTVAGRKCTGSRCASTSKRSASVTLEAVGRTRRMTATRPFPRITPGAAVICMVLGVSAPAQAFVPTPGGGHPGELDLNAQVTTERGKTEPNENQKSFMHPKGWYEYKLGLGYTCIRAASVLFDATRSRITTPAERNDRAVAGAPVRRRPVPSPGVHRRSKSRGGR
jgi:hypothetical protein